MNKTDLVRAISEKAEITQKDVDIILKSYIDVITEALQNGEKVAIPGFCPFEVKERAETGIHPFTESSS